MSHLHIADLFCGAGGTSTGAIEAIESLGHTAQLTAINHWPVAVATHEKNHPTSRHFCASLDALNPRDLFKPGELKLLWASPECTHHSVARGGTPINDQSRATAWCVTRWAEALRPDTILVENVPEFRTWGPIGSNGRPLKSRKGETFEAWLNSLRSLGYTVDHRILVAADYGDPTTRRRLFVQAVRGKRRICWPNATHSAAGGADLLGSTKPWVAAREIIDWNLPGQSIYERKRPLSEKTMRRIWAGLEKFGLGPFIVPQHGSNGPRSVDTPAPTVTTTSRGVGMVEPFLLDAFGERKGQKVRARGVNSPLPTVTAQKGGPSLVEPFLICMEHQGSVRSVDRPMPTITTARGGAIGMAKPYLVRVSGSEDRRPRSIEEPLQTVTAGGVSHGLAEPFLIHAAHGGERRPHPIGEPLPTVAGNRGDMALVQPFVISAGGPECAARGVDDPLGTVLTRDHRALVEAALLPQGQGGVLRAISDPIPTVATDGAIALVEPFLVEYYGTGKPQSVDSPAGTVTCRDRFGLVRPVVIVDGERYLLDIRFRMLQPKELAGAQGFRTDYHFTGNKSEQVKQIGNAVPRRLARAICAAALGQNPDVSFLTDDTPPLPISA